MKRLLKQFFTATTTKLATTYLLIIMLMSIGFSIVFYNTSSHALDRQIPPNDAMFRTRQENITQQPQNTKIRDFLNRRAEEGRDALAMRLVVLNVTALLGGGVISYLLARRSLRPIEQAMEAQVQFVSDASHELRTPLTSIQTSNDVALRNTKLTLADAKQIIKENTEETIKLKQLSDGLLNLAKNDHTRTKLQPVSIQAALAEAINQVIPAAQEKHIVIDDHSPNWHVLSNQQALSQVLVILLDNALKYSSKKSTVYVTATKKGNHAYVHVQDEGIGIRASDMPHVFRRFYRADAARSDGHRQGYGLGLAIAANITSVHDASISVQSELGVGSTFTVKLRLAKA
ncbi:hypothetical protein BH09PAT3_BH09PAT3_3470 [soil metagenome]